MRRHIEFRDPRSNGPTTSPIDGVEDLVGASSPTDARVHAAVDHDVRERHFHWPETERTRAVWADWEWRAWGVGHRARAAVRRAWRGLTTRDHARHAGGDRGDPPAHAAPAPIDERRVPRR
jgi:hypothetical protein